MSCFNRISSASIGLRVYTPLYECFPKKNFKNSCEGSLLLTVRVLLFLATVKGMAHARELIPALLRGQESS